MGLKKIILPLAFLLVLPIAFAQDLCGNPYFSAGTASVAIVTATPAFSTAAGASTSASSTPSALPDPIVSTGGNNCFDNVIFTVQNWNNFFATGPSNGIIVNTPQETLAVVNTLGALDVGRIKWYTQDGLTPGILTAPEIEIDYGFDPITALHAAVSDGPDIGDMILVTFTFGGNIFVGRYRATSIPIVWDNQLDDALTALNFIDYNSAADRLAVLANDGSDIVVLVFNTLTGALVSRVAVDSGAATTDVGHGIQINDAGDVFVYYSAGFPGPAHVISLTGSTINWDTILEPGFSEDNLGQDNRIALDGTNLYVAANLATLGGNVFRMDQATGTADFRGDLGVDVFLNGIIPASTLATGVYFYGEDEFNGQGAAGLIADGSPPTFTWTARFPDAEMWNGAAEGDFARIYLAGRDALGDSAGNFVVATTGAVDAGVGTSVDIGGDAGADEFQDVVERPTFGYFDVFTLVGQNSDGDTLVLQTSFPPPCNNGVFEPGFEECEAGIDETACPGYCSAFDCTCSKEASFTLFDLAIGHNMLFSKVQDLLHIVKDFLVQLEFKTIEFTLANYACDDQPVSFWFPSDQDPYGKLHEIDSMIQLLIDSLQRGLDAGGDFGTIDGADLSDAQGRLDEAENQINLGNFRRALECKCLAYKGLAEITDTSAPPLNDCLIP